MPAADGARGGGGVIRAALTVANERAEELRTRFVELAPEGFEECQQAGGIEFAAYGAAAERVLAAFADASCSMVADGWEERWRDFHRAVEVGPLWVGPPWQTPGAGAIAVVIDPGRAFGTGAHPTTRLCLELLLAEERGSVLDVGCGSGVLAIAAAALGFGPVVGVDADPVAVAVAGANAEANAVTVAWRTLDICTQEPPQAQLAVANIAFEVVEMLGPRLRSGRLIASGYRAVDHPRPTGFDAVARVELDGWAADLFVSRSLARTARRAVGQ